MNAPSFCLALPYAHIWKVVLEPTGSPVAAVRLESGIVILCGQRDLAGKPLASFPRATPPFRETL